MNGQFHETVKINLMNSEFKGNGENNFVNSKLKRNGEINKRYILNGLNGLLYYCHSSLWYLKKKIYGGCKDLQKPFGGTIKKCKNKTLR